MLTHKFIIPIQLIQQFQNCNDDYYKKIAMKDKPNSEFDSRTHDRAGEQA